LIFLDKKQVGGLTEVTIAFVFYGSETKQAHQLHSSGVPYERILP
jgi:hypothetical protein